MQIYIVGIGQCGTSVTYDVISNLAGIVKSKDVTSWRQGPEVATNELVSMLNRDMRRHEKLLAKVLWWAERIWSDAHGNRFFIPPKLAIIDGNPDNFVKSAFEQFRGNFTLGKDESNNQELKHLADLILTTQVLDLGAWRGGCANGIVGEQVAFTNLPPGRLRNALGVDDYGQLAGTSASIDVFLVVSSGGGATGSGGGVYLGRSRALVEGTRTTLVLNALVLPSTTMSADNKRYALNAGRALARHANTGLLERTSGGGDDNDIRPSSTVLFSNPRDEGSSSSLQRLNDYVAEFAIRMSNFSYPENVARLARDLDVRELVRFMLGNVSVLAMGHLESEFWGAEDVEHMLVEHAFAGLYDKLDKCKKAHGLSVERQVELPEGLTDVLDSVESAMVVIGVPPRFRHELSLTDISSCLRKITGSQLCSGVQTFSYGSTSDVELTVFLRYRSMHDNSLARYFIRQFVGDEWTFGVEEVLETEYLRSRVEQDDDYTRAFKEVAADLAELGGSFDFDAFVMRRQESFFPRVPSSRSEGGAQGP